KPGSTYFPDASMAESAVPRGRLWPMAVIVRPSTFTSASNRSPAFTTVPPRITNPMGFLRTARRLARSPSPAPPQPHPRLLGVRVLVRLQQHVVLVQPGGECAARLHDLDAACAHVAERRAPRRDGRAHDALSPGLGREERRADH